MSLHKNSLLYHGYIQLQGPWRCQINAAAAFLEGQGFPITCSSWRHRSHLEGPGVMEETNPNDALLSGKSLKSIRVLNQKYVFFYMFLPPKSSHFKEVWNHYFHHPFWGTIWYHYFWKHPFKFTIHLHQGLIIPTSQKMGPISRSLPLHLLFLKRDAFISAVDKIFSEASHYQWVVPMNCQPCPAVGNGWIFLEVPMKRGFIEKNIEDQSL